MLRIVGTVVILGGLALLWYRTASVEQFAANVGATYAGTWVVVALARSGALRRVAFGFIASRRFQGASRLVTCQAASGGRTKSSPRQIVGTGSGPDRVGVRSGLSTVLA
jgi:hypothetical protein